MRSILGRVMAIVSPAAAARGVTGRFGPETGASAHLPGSLAYALIALTALALGSCEEYPTDIAVIEPPSITGIQMTPDSANVTNDDVEIAVSVGARGSGGVDSVVVAFAGPNDDDELSCVASRPVAGDRTNGDWACDVLLAAGSAPGLWRLSNVELHHGGGEVLRLIVDDLQEAGYAIDILVLAYLPPLVGIEAPTDGSSFSVGDTVRFEGWASVRIDDGGEVGDTRGEVTVDGVTGATGDTAGSGQALTDSALVWTSDLDGQLGVGEEFATTALSEGTHLITLTATDPNGLSASDSVRIRIGVAGPVVASVEVIPASVSLVEVGDTIRLQAVARTAAGEVVSDVVVDWMSADTTVAVVDADGIVTARGAGVTQILAEIDGVGGTARITVEIVEAPPLVDLIIVEPGQAGLAAPGDTITLRARAYDPAGDVIPGLSYTWRVDTDVVTIAADDTSALVTAVKVGMATIEVAIGELSEAVPVVVGGPVVEITGASPEPTEGGYLHGTEITFEGSAVSRDGSPVPDFRLVWRSDRDGDLGTGTILTTSELSAGSHTITLAATDHYGLRASDTLEVVITQPKPELLLAAITPEVFDLEWLGGGGFEGPDAIVLVVVPDPNSPAPDTIDATLTGPTGQSFTCEITLRVDPADMTDIFPGISPDSQPWGCALTFGIPLDEDGTSPIDPEELAAALDTIELGTWRITEIGMRHAGNWHTLDEAALGAAGHELSVEVIRTEPIAGVHAIFVTPWRATVPGLGSTTQLTATAVDDTGENPVPGVTFTWTSFDPHIATVDQNGLVTGHSPGVTGITASAGAITSHPTEVYVFEVGPPIAWDTIVAGPWHSCGLAQGRAYCWGNNEDGRLGTGDREMRFVPTLVAGGHTFTTLALGVEFTIAIDENGRAYAWGRNNRGQLGDGTTTDRLTPTEVAGGHTFTAISAGNAHAVALTEKGTVLTWGDNGNGQLGDNGAPRDNRVPAPVLGSDILGQSFTAVSAGYGFTMALRADSTLHTWGANSYGQLGHGDRVLARNEPRPVIDQDTQLPMKFTSIDAGSYHAVAVDPNGQGWSWGSGGFGNLGNGSGGNSPYPSRISGDIKFAWIGAGGSHTLAIGTDGTVWGWGEGLQGQLGSGTRERYYVPTMIAQLQGFVLLSLGDMHNLGLNAMGMAYAWGWSANGMLGNGGLEDQLSPVPVLGPVQ